MKKLKRPFITRYFDEPGGAAEAHGACTTEEGAIRATVVRIFVGQWLYAVVFDRSKAGDVPIYTIKRTGNALTVHYGRGVPVKPWKGAKR